MSMRWAKLYKGTPAELALEDAVASLGVPYRTQFPGYMYGFRYFPDFFLPTLGLVIEVDDSSHYKAEKMAADAERTAALNKLGWKVVRCRNDEALSDPYGTVRAMLASVGLWPLPKKLPRVASVMPKPGACSQKERRASKMAARRERLAGRARGSGQPSRSPKWPQEPPPIPDHLLA